MKATSTNTIPVNITMDRMITACSDIADDSLQLHAGEGHKAQRHKASGNEGNAQALQGQRAHHCISAFHELRQVTRWPSAQEKPEPTPYTTLSGKL
jgi:hypothetical protein